MAEIEDIYYSTDYSNLNMMNAQSLDLYLASCGWQNCSPRHWFGPAIKRYSMIHVVRRGKGRMRLGGKLYEIHKDQAFYIPPRVEVWYQADDTDPWDYVWFAFEGLKEASCVENAGFSMKEPVRDICCTEEVCAYVHQMMDAHQLSFDNELRRNGLLFLCMSKLVEDYWTVTGLSTGHHFYPGEVYVKAAQEYISSHFHERIKINELADLIGVNRSYLTRNFKAIVGCSSISGLKRRKACS